MQRHPEPGLHGGAGLHHGAEDAALPAESGGADGLGGAESPHPRPPVRQTCTQGGGHRWAGHCNHCNDSNDDNNGHWAFLSWDSLRCLHFFYINIYLVVGDSKTRDHMPAYIHRQTRRHRCTDGDKHTHTHTHIIFCVFSSETTLYKLYSDVKSNNLYGEWG